MSEQNGEVLVQQPQTGTDATSNTNVDNNVTSNANNSVTTQEIDNNKAPEVVKKEFTQIEIDNIIKSRVKSAEKKGYEAARKEFLSKLGEEDTITQQVNNTVAPPNPEFINGYSAAQNEYKQALDRRAAQDVTTKLGITDDEKMQETVNFFSDFKDGAVPMIWNLNSVDNTKDVYGFLKENPNAKAEINNLIQLDMLALSNGRSSTMAHHKLMQISQQLKQNSEAETNKANSPKPPLSNDNNPSKIIGGTGAIKGTNAIMQAQLEKRRGRRK